MSTRRIRWWWWLGMAWLAVCIVAWFTLTGRPAWRRLIFSHLVVALTPLLLGVAWMLVVAPYLESGMTSFTDRGTARRRWRICHVFAWTPTVIFALLCLWAVVVKAAGIQHHGWLDGGYEWYALGATVLSVFYGRLMSRHLQRRIRGAAWSVKACFRCNYHLEGIESARCPECGEPIVRVAAMVVLASIVLGFAGCAAPPPPVRIATDGVFPPFHYVDDDGRLAGHDVEVAGEAVERTGRRAQVLRGDSFAELFRGLQFGKYDMIAATTGITEQRQRRYAFTRPYFQTCLAVMVRTDTSYTIPADLRGHRVTASAGTTSVAAARGIEGAIVIELPSARAMRDALRSGAVDAIVVDEFEAVEWSRDDDAFRVLPEPVALESYGFMLRLADTELRQDLDTALDEMAGDGTLANIRRRHGLDRPADWPVRVPALQ
ncbi:MAG: amino acid ABC transporter substrate-binding protein [Planctomycetes bacterium]|nr:amino acid ABC transporter substrate-binding protein [Planctomycetota bacterium]